MCGERQEKRVITRTTHGSSPRVRGTGRHAPDSGLPQRFIPACAGNGPQARSFGRRSTVHPRVCGERQEKRVITRTTHGSSPRVRGTGRHAPDSGLPQRFIPACAGNGVATCYEILLPPVHPRVCGERGRSALFQSSWLGSSPRVRGTVNLHASVVPVVRFIPACAGNGVATCYEILLPPVHPRVCGERGRSALFQSSWLGSSPRVRGTVNLHASVVPVVRFIPACAGNGHDVLPNSGQLIGSSPRVRGTVAAARTFGAVVRFIPACAGNGPQERVALVVTAVHPRVCGERQHDALPNRRELGSSPRVRGTAATLQRDGLAGRFIPACAGNGRERDEDTTRCTVHPRVCGERLCYVSVAVLLDGSSPRVRGTGRHAAAPSRVAWFIPACAGNGSPPAVESSARPVHPRVCGERRNNGSFATLPTGSSPRVRGTD